MMDKLTRDDLYSLEKYSEMRPEFRARVLEHKKNRKLPLGPSATLYFEDRLTMHYQVQEMLRAERIFEVDGIEDELSAYNPLIPDGTNWKATFMIEVPDPEARRKLLAKLVGVEDQVWVKVGELPAVYAVADEDMERETEEKTSSVHFLRFELSPEMIQAAKSGVGVSAGIDHPEYRQQVTLPEAVAESLASDLD